jgi:hypothetical protein
MESSLPRANPNRGFELMKIAGIRLSLSMMRTKRTGAGATGSAEKPHRMHNSCG